MKLNQDLVNRLCGLDDEALWAEIRSIATNYGLKLPDKTPTAAELAKVRGALNLGEIRTADAMRLVNEYKRRQG
jgi:hypothetical protein